MTKHPATKASTAIPRLHADRFQHKFSPRLLLQLVSRDNLAFPFSDSEIDAVVCLGVVLKGDTMHFEMIIDEVVRGLGEVSRQGRVPIINEILPVTDLAQAKSRAADDGLNKGIEAAVAAIEIIAWRRGL